MIRDELDEAIYKKYFDPLKRKRTGVAGLEFELPIVNLSGDPVSFDAVHEMTDHFIRLFSFSGVRRDDEGAVYFAEDPKTGDSISFDCSYNTLEFSFGVEENLNIVYRRFLNYYSYVQRELRTYGNMLTGMGLNPGRDVNLKMPVSNGRYRMLFHHLCSYKKYGKIIPFHDRPDYGLFSCASQCQFDVDEGSVVEVLNTFTLLEPLKALLFANSPYGDMLLSRDFFWKYSMHGVNPHNVGMWEGRIGSVSEIARYIRSMSIYCMERDGKYINIPPMMLDDYFNADFVRGEYFDGESYREIDVVPEIGDLAYLRSFKLDDLTFRGTVEFRSVCAQPVSEIMAPAAYTAGLLRNLPTLTELLENNEVLYNPERPFRREGADTSGSGGSSDEKNLVLSPTRLRMLFSKGIIPDYIDRRALFDLLIRTVAIAEDGLGKRGYEEQKFIRPLYERAEKLTNPALVMTEGLKHGMPIRAFVEQYS